MGQIPKINGEYEYGYQVKKEYFDQQMDSLDLDLTVFDDFYKDFPSLTTTEIRKSLGAFLFSGEEVFKEVKVLSGGEKVRLQLCKIFKKQPNLLLLDEPTNHMDIVGKESLENILQEYQGTLIFVSHDRYFVNKIADCILAFEPEGVVYFNGSYEEYASKKEERQIKEWEEKVDKKENQTKKKNSNNLYLQNKEKARKQNKAKKLEKEIEDKEEQIALLKLEMQKEEMATDYIKLKELQDKIQELEDEIERKMIEWEALNED